jgi:adenylyl-sulfate kinase
MLLKLFLINLIRNLLSLIIEGLMKGITFWITGLPCSGKTTVGLVLKQKLTSRGHNMVHLDGDIIRKGLNKDLGFSHEDRIENLRRVAHVAELFNQNGQDVIATFVSPTNVHRELVGSIISNIKLIHADCSPAKCETRDCRGMYAKARQGEIKEFTGVSAPFEKPSNEHISVDTEHISPDESAEIIIEKLNL